MVMEKGIANMIHDFFCDDLSHAPVTSHLDEEAKNRHEREAEIKEQCNQMLYKGEKVSKVQVLLSLINIQIVYDWSNVSVSALFQLFHKILPEGTCVPKSCQVAKKTLTMLGLEYESIHDYPNDHVLF